MPEETTLTLAHQYIDQLPQALREAVFGNVGSLIAFRTGARDAPEIARQLDLPKAAQLRDLPNFAAWASILTDGMPSEPFHLDPFDPPEPLHNRAERIKRHSTLRFGRNRRQVEHHVAAFYAA